MEKRGQVTIFIVLGVIIVLIIGFLFYYQGYVREGIKTTLVQETALTKDVDNVKENIQRCVEDTTVASLYLVGLQGGYYNVDDGMEVEDLKIAYNYDKGKDKVPSLNTIEEEIDDFVKDNLPRCVNLDNLKDFEVDTRDVNTKVNIKDDEVKFKVDYKVILKQGEKVYRLFEPYDNTVDVRFGFIYNVVKGVVNNEVNDPDNIDITYLLDSGLDVDVVTLEDEVVYILNDGLSSVDDVPYVYMFANRF